MWSLPRDGVVAMPARSFNPDVSRRARPGSRLEQPVCWPQCARTHDHPHPYGCIYGACHGTDGWGCASRSQYPARHGWFRHVFMAGGSRQTHSLGGSPVINTQRVNLFGNFHRCVSNALAVLIVGEGFHDARARARTCALASRAASVIAVIAVMCVCGDVGACV